LDAEAHALAAGGALARELRASHPRRLSRRVRAAHRSPPYAALRARARDPRMLARPVIDRSRCFRGIDTLSAAGVCSEIGDFRRFPSPTLLAGFGIVPSERTSDTKRRQSRSPRPARTRGGCWSRPLTITAIHPDQGDARSPPSRPESACIAIAWRVQRRLYQHWQHLHQHRRKPAGVVAIACARELATSLWKAATLA
jgi:transposase